MDSMTDSTKTMTDGEVATAWGCLVLEVMLFISFIAGALLSHFVAH